MDTVYGLSLPWDSAVPWGRGISQTSVTALKVCPAASDIPALKIFISGSCTPFAGTAAPSQHLARGWGEVTFPFAEPQPAVFPGSSAVLCKIPCCWRLRRVRKMPGSAESIFCPSPGGTAWRALSRLCPRRFWCRQLLSTRMDVRTKGAGRAGMSHCTTCPSFPSCLPQQVWFAPFHVLHGLCLHRSQSPTETPVPWPPSLSCSAEPGLAASRRLPWLRCRLRKDALCGKKKFLGFFLFGKEFCASCIISHSPFVISKGAR